MPDLNPVPPVLGWDELREGDVLVLPCSNGPVPIRLVATCRKCASPEIWNQVCECGSPTCSKTVQSINVRQCFANNPGLIRVNRDDKEYRNP